MGKMLGRWLGAMLLLIGLAIGLFWLAKPLSDRGFDWLAKFSEVASLVVAVIGLLLPGISRIARWLRAAAPVSQQQIDNDRANLQRALRERWREERPSPESQVYEAPPMRVRFEITQPGDDVRLGDLNGAASTDAAVTAQGQAGEFDRVLEIFLQQPRRRWVILGEAGAGKTVLAAELARRLLLDPSQSEGLLPISLPAVVWNPRRESLSDCLARQLSANYAWLSNTHARVLVSDGKLLPILDGLDEMRPSLRKAAIAEINGYGWDRPLVVTSRRDEYWEAVEEFGGRGVARSGIVGLCPMLPQDIKIYLDPTSSGRWVRVFSKLDVDPEGPLAEVLTTPLMLWLANVIYSSKSPDDLADSPFFSSRTAIEHYLLGELVPAVYAEGAGQRNARKFKCTVEQAQRWLGFLAGDDHIKYKPWNDMSSGVISILRRRRNPDEFPDAGTLAWWQFRAAARGWRLLGMGLRAVLLFGVITVLLALVLARHGSWRHVGYLGDLVLGGPIGRLIRPTVDKLGTAAAPRTAQNLPQVFLAQLRPAGVFGGILPVAFIPLIWYLFYAIFVGSPLLGPKRLQFRALLVLSKILIGMILCGVVCVGAAILISASALSVYTTSHPSYRAVDVPAVISSRSTLLSLLAVCLLGLTWIPLSFASRADIFGAVGPPELLRLDRQADLVTTLSHRSLLSMGIWLFCGPRLAVAYAVFAISATLVAITLGGQRAFASRSYTDARIWLACRGRLPWRTMHFLADASSRGVLRQVGAVYQFRHIRLQKQLEDSWRRTTWGLARTWERGYRWRARREAIADLNRKRTGRREETLAGMCEAMDGYMGLDPADRHQIPAGLAASLARLTWRLYWSAETEQAISGLREVVAAYRVLADADWAEFRPRLADALDDLASRLGRTWREQEALRAASEAVDIYRELAKSNPAKYLPVLANKLQYIAHQFTRNGQDQEARAATSEENEIRQQLTRRSLRELTL
jgi:hypothetical protein